MRGRFIIDMHPKSDAVTVLLEDHTAADIVAQEVIGDLVICHLDKDGNVLEVEIILPPHKRTSHESGFDAIEEEEC